MRTVLFLIVVAWLLVPTGTPDDVLVIGLINLIGLRVYFFIVTILLAVLWYNKVTFKKVHSEIKRLFSKKRFKK